MPSLHERAKDLFLEALNYKGVRRTQFVTEQCGEDTALQAEVESLLQFHDESSRGSASTGLPSSSVGPSDSLKSGDVFANRYRMIARIGRGGMGDVWRADDLVLGTPVALKLIHSTGAAARAQIIGEVRLARQITHPAVCRVFDVGEDQGQAFLSMELVEGEDLATLLKRVGRLSSEKVLEIARQLCEGLAAAHARGVLHRDLKPANVLIDNEGRVRITDFGVAVKSEDGGSHNLVGTPAYMAPEQLTRGGQLSDATDIYALGLILYELLVGQHPFNRSSPSGPPSPPSVKVANVDPTLEQTVLQALTPDPGRRPPTARAMAAMLPSAEAEAPRGMRVWVIGTVAALAVIALAVGAFFYVPGGQARLSEQDSIILADFTNTTGEPVFDGTLKVALAVALEQSPFLKVFPDDRMRETLRLMGRASDAAVTPAVAREIAQREQVKALVSGSIARLGTHFVIALEAVNAETGDVMAREQVETATREEVLGALGSAVSQLRQKLGESLPSIQKFDTPLARATTPSLEALHAYSLALEEGRATPRLEALPYLRRALELDPQFALALALTANVYTNTGQSALATEYARRAFELRDRVSERERFIIGFRYYRDALQDWEQALEISQLWTETYPREPFAFNSLGVAQLTLGRSDAAIRSLQRAIELDPKFTASYANLAAVLMAANRAGEARSVLEGAAAQKLEFAGMRRISYLIAFMNGDQATMTRDFQSSIGVGQTNTAYGWEARTLAFGGRLEAAHEQFRRGVQLAIQGSFREVASQHVLIDAEIHAMVGRCEPALQETPEGLALSRDNFALERAGRVFALCGREAEAAATARELVERYPKATMTVRVAVPLVHAGVALRRGDGRRAVEILEPLRIYDHAPRGEYWVPYLRGQAHLQARDGRAAIEDFRSILDNRGENPNWPLYTLAQLGLGRAQVLAGDQAAARESYSTFLKSWERADENLPLLTQARRELAAIP
jgi:eukaryotic-like serine/threonine-protein kinase